MRVIAGVFAVSVIAIVSVIPARAEVVSTELLDKRLGTEGNLAAVAASGSYNDLANKPTIPAAANDATLDIQKNGTSVGTFTANASTNKVINITVPTGTLASKNTVTSAEITDGTIVNADISGSAAIAPSKIAIDTVSTYENIPAADKEKRIPSVALAEEIAGATADAAVSSAVANVGKTYQVKSTAAYQMGGANGAWTTMSADQQNALNSKVTAAKVTTYDGYATTIANKQDKSTAVTHTANTAAGDSTHPVYVNASGVATKIDKVAAAAAADTATSATKATQDASGNTITTTYATKSEMNAVKSTAEGKQDALTAGAYITITKDETSGKTTIASTGPTYTLPAATANALGGVKSGGNITVGTDGAVTVNQAASATNATNATNATKATQDASGNTITTTYATKTELTNGLAGKQGTLKAGSNISIAADGTISATDTNTTYGAAGTGLGLVKSGGVATVSGGQITAVSKATNADNATNATNATTATNAKKICSGSTCTSFVDIWVE